jgi:hypothetical protein
MFMKKLFVLFLILVSFTSFSFSMDEERKTADYKQKYEHTKETVVRVQKYDDDQHETYVGYHKPVEMPVGILTIRWECQRNKKNNQIECNVYRDLPGQGQSGTPNNLPASYYFALKQMYEEQQ